MQRKKMIALWVVTALLMTFSSGCALVGAAISAGISYGIYQATK